jgi:hypothetical protein
LKARRAPGKKKGRRPAVLTWQEVKALLRRPAKADSRVLSAYLTVPLSGVWKEKHPFGAAYGDLLHDLERTVPPAGLEELWKDSKAVARHLASSDRLSRSVAVFSDASDGFFWARDLEVPLPNLAVWKPKPHVLPLLEALDEFERYAVALVEKSRARLFFVRLGEVEETLGVTASARIHRISTTGRDNLRSQTNLARGQERESRRHLEKTAEVLTERMAKLPFGRLFVGGPKEAVAAFRKVLRPPLRDAYAGTVALDARASPREVLAATLRMERTTERTVEAGFIRDLIEASGRSPSSLVGLDAVLRHIERSPVRTLYYAEGFDGSGSRCGGCGFLYSRERQGCGHCGSATEPVEDLLQEMAAAVVEKGGRVEEVRGEAARLLRGEGGVGVALGAEHPAAGKLA